MRRYRVLEILGAVLVVVGFVVMGIGGASLLLNLSAIPLGRVVGFVVVGTLLYAAGVALRAWAQRHLQ